MFVLLNGSFGIGKTTTAKALVAEQPATSIFDPEPLGIALQRAARVFGGTGRVVDFQDVALWRRATVWGARLHHRRADTVIIPMAFSNILYVDRLTEALSATAPVMKLCLVAPLAVGLDRLERRAQTEGKVVDEWVRRRAAECCAAHRSDGFGHPVDATGPTRVIVEAVAALMVRDDRRHPRRSSGR